MMEKSLSTAYELRRNNFDNGEAHLKYVGIFFGGEHKLDDLLSSTEEVSVATAVSTKNDTGELTWYILEDRKDINAHMNELSINTELAKRLLKQKVGQEVVTSSGGISTVKVTIVEIKSKYVYALNESLKLLPERFAETEGIERFSFKSGSEDETRQSVEQMLDVISKRTDWVTQAEKFYRESKLTVGAFAHLIGKNVIEVWNGLVGSKWGVKTCMGTLEERKEAFESLEKNNTITIDVTALLTAERLGILGVIEQKFESILIAQSTIDLLQELISDRKGMGSRGYSTIGKEGDKFVREEITPEIIKAQTEYLERIKIWVKKHCKVTPCKIVPKIEKRKELKDILGMSFLETLLIAKEQKTSLYTDDFGTKALAKSEDFGAIGVWTQVIMMHALVNKQMTEDAYNKATLHLVQLGYRHTTISGAILIESARQSKWTSTGPYIDIIETLRGPQIEVKSAVGVFTEFLSLLSQQPILDSQRETLIMTALDVVTDQRDVRAVIRLIREIVRIRIRTLPFAEARIQQIISAWETLRMGSGRIGF